MGDDIDQLRVVSAAHAIPRFGHSNSIAKLASYSRADQEDYIRGILSFCAFFLTSLFVWGMVLVFFKFVLADRVGCAAGGGTIDVAELRKARIPRHIRRARILRAWHLQWAFFFVSILIPITTLLINRNGLAPLIASLDEVEDIADDVEAKAYVGISIAESLTAQQEKVNFNFTQQDMNLLNICPDISKFQSNISLVDHSHSPMLMVTEYIQVGLSDLNIFIEQHARPTQTALHNFVRITRKLEESIEWTYANDWALKFFLTVINVVNGFFLFGLFLSKQDIVSFNYQRFLSVGMIPFWVVLLICSMILACAFGTALMLNADFCHGEGTPEGTIKQILIERGMQKTGVVYKSFLHYVQGCLDGNPLQFLKDMDPMIGHTTRGVTTLMREFAIYSDNEIRAGCTAKMNTLIDRLPYLVQILDETQQKIRAAEELTGCHQISPIIRRILHGSTCSKTVEGLTWLFAGMVTVTILGFMMLSTRAALFNSILRAPRRKRRREREKEFEEYKDYMATFYEDAKDWKLDSDWKKKALETEIPRTETFETEKTSIPSKSPQESEKDAKDDSSGGSDACVQSHVAYIESPKSEASSQSSYESDYSSDSDVERSPLSHSVVGRIFNFRKRRDDNQSSMLGVSTLGFDETPTESRTASSILDLQTPRRRRKQLHDPYAFLRSPEEPHTPSSMGLQIASPQATRFHGSRSIVSPQATPSRTTPSKNSVSLAPVKPKRLIQRIKGATKEA